MGWRKHWFWYVSKPGVKVRVWFADYPGMWLLGLARAIFRRTLHRCVVCGRLAHMGPIMGGIGIVCNQCARAHRSYLRQWLGKKTKAMAKAERGA